MVYQLLKYMVEVVGDYCTFQAYHGENYLNFVGIMMSTLFYINILSCIYVVLSISFKQQSAGRHIAPLGHIILIQSQTVFALTP